MSIVTTIQSLARKALGLNHPISEIQNLRNEFRNRLDISSLCLQIAREDSARYVMKNMAKSRSFDTVEDILDFGLSCVEESLKQELYLEFGVWKGRSINRIAEHTKTLVYGFDSFEGLPESWRTGFEAGEFSLQTKNLPTVKPNVSLIVGWFDETLPTFLEKTNGNIALLHVDCDLYSSTKTIFDLIKDRIVKNSIIVFDEYFGYPTWECHEFLAFQEFIEKNGRTYEYLGYNSTHEQVVVRITN